MTIPPGMPSWALAQMAANLDPPVDTSIGQHVRIMPDKSWCVFPFYQDMGFPGATTQSYDDLSVINWAAANIGRGVVVLAPGVFTAASAAGLTVPTGVVLRGQGLSSQILWDQTVTPTLVQGSAGSPSQHASIEDLRLSQTNATPGGTCVDMSQFQFSTLERVTIDGQGAGARPNIGVLHNAGTCHYNVNRDLVVFVDGANAIGISYTNGSNSNVLKNARVIISGSDATQTGIYVNAYAIELDHPDIENFAGTGIKIDSGATSNRPTAILHHYLEPGAGAGTPISIVNGGAPPALAAQASTFTVPVRSGGPGGTSRTSNSLLNDPDLQFNALLGPRTYRITLDLLYDGVASGAGNLAVAFTVPGGASFTWAPLGLASQSVTTPIGNLSSFGATAAGTQRNFATAGPGNPCALRIVGILTTATTSGTFALQWAQQTTNATATIMYAGSSMRVEQIA